MEWQNLATLAVVAVVFLGIRLLRRRGVNFSLLTLLALVAGIPIGLVAGQHADWVEPIGRIYVNVLLASVAPLVVVAIVSSITALGDVAKLRTIGLRSVAWLLLSNAIGVALALGLGLAVGTGLGVDEELGGEELSVLENSVQDFGEVVVNFFPVNIVGDLAGNKIIPIILVSVVLSVAYLSLAERDSRSVRPFRDGVEALKLVIFKAVGMVIGLTPYAIVALTVTVVSTTADLQDKFWSLIGLLALTWGTCFAHMWLVNGVLLRVFADVSPLAFFRKVLPAQLTAFSTQSSVGTLPVTTDVLTRRVGVHPEVAHFTAPLGTTIGMPGCAGIWPLLIAVWGINAYGIPYTTQDYLVLALLGVVVSVGTAGVPGAATVAAVTVFAAAGLPLEFVAVTLPISTIADMARTATNVTAAAVSATVVARQTGLLDDEIFEGRAEFDPAAHASATVEDGAGDTAYDVAVSTPEAGRHRVPAT
ncbi:dicarboxylate/amino acid:cation symporter [Nocardioides jishulii]|uniref:Dicarboxylate/amino acid:cation symporter n=1 Tax=Nocardioides jishulii TaxID=2575440 RepID=A0A4U2YLI3_9ACTN|nr:dicarboxylate/amino acid:cation symporter [Nocardioides jishulii]QCX26879.1 dicarboxylate/amino acid:cation symporter [Nocardioides jishulii]TKI61362.1 dicarboxylate/amino acid:cation symporter [Nocardioides jishulii]